MPSHIISSEWLGWHVVSGEASGGTPCIVSICASARATTTTRRLRTVTIDEIRNPENPCRPRHARRGGFADGHAAAAAAAAAACASSYQRNPGERTASCFFVLTTESPNPCRSARLWLDETSTGPAAAGCHCWACHRPPVEVLVCAFSVIIYLVSASVELPTLVA